MHCLSRIAWAYCFENINLLKGSCLFCITWKVWNHKWFDIDWDHCWKLLLTEFSGRETRAENINYIFMKTIFRVVFSNIHLFKSIASAYCLENVNLLRRYLFCITWKVSNHKLFCIDWDHHWRKFVLTLFSVDYVIFCYPLILPNFMTRLFGWYTVIWMSTLLLYLFSCFVCNHL